MGGRPGEKRDSTSGTGPVRGFERLGEGDFHRQLAATPGVAVVLFSAPHCGACRRWKQLLPRALADLSGAWYEIDVSEATGVARYFDIFHLPTIYLYRDGRFHAELQCAATENEIHSHARALLAAPPGDEP